MYKAKPTYYSTQRTGSIQHAFRVRMGQQLAEESRDVHRGTSTGIGENGQESFQAGLGFHGAAQDKRAVPADAEHGIHISSLNVRQTLTDRPGWSTVDRWIERYR